MNPTAATTAHTSFFLLPTSRRRRAPSLASLRAAAPASVASLPLLPLSVPVDSAAAVVPGALRWGRRRTWGCGLWVVEQGGARRRRRGGVYFPSILPLPHSLLLLFS
jgi:hypothetical protein